MVHPEGEATGAEVEVETTAPDTQGAEETQTQDTTDEPDFYEEGNPFEDDADQEEDQAGEDEAEEPIEAPVSLKADEKEKFSQLPREAQQALTEIIQRREQDAQKGVESAQNAQREAQSRAADEIAQAQRAFAQQTAAVVAAFAPQPPPLELARTDPAEYQYRKALFEEESAGFNQLVQQLTGLHSEAEGHFTQREQQANAERLKGLLSIPEVANEETRGQFLNDIGNFGTEQLGYSLEALAQMDATDLAAIKRSKRWKEGFDKWEAHQKKRNERPREAKGRFASAPVGARTAAQPGQNDALKALYPND